MSGHLFSESAGPIKVKLKPEGVKCGAYSSSPEKDIHPDKSDYKLQKNTL